MLCRRCTALSARGGGGGEGNQPQSARPAPLWGAERISGLCCDRCRTPLGVEDISQLLLQKQSQLAQFGLLTPRPPRGPQRWEDD